MADLTGNAFLQREAAPVLKNVAVKHDYRDPDKTAGSEDFAKAGLWDAVGQASGELAKIYGNFDHNLQEAKVSNMEEEIQKEFMNNDVGIQGSLQDLNATDLDPKSKLSDFNGEGLKLPDGSIVKMKALEEYEGYEDLNPAHKRTIQKFYNTSRDQTQNNLMTELTKLSKSHTKLSLGKLSVSVQANNLRILSDPKSWVKEKPMAPFLKKYLDSFGRIDDDFPNVSAKQFKQHIFNKIRTGKITDIPGAPSMGGAMPSDIGVKGGLTDEARKNIDIELERLSSKVFKNIGNSIDFDEANVIINTNMQQLLKNQFLANYNQNPEAAIDKARDRGYRYTREYDGLHDLGTIEYILDPEILSTYLQQYDSKARAKATDPEIMFRLQQKLEGVDPKTFDIETYIKKIVANPDIRHDDEKYHIIGLAAKMMEKHKEAVAVQDASAIRSQLKIQANNDPDFLYKMVTENPETGEYTLKSDAEILALVRDKTETIEKYEYPEGIENLEGKTTIFTKVTKATDREGIKKLLSNKKAFYDLINSTSEAVRKSDLRVLTKSDQENFINPDSIINTLERYASSNTNYEKVDFSKLDQTWNSDLAIRRIFKQNKEDFVSYAMDTVKLGNAAKSSKGKDKLKLIAGSVENDDALNAALAKKQTIFLQRYVNSTQNAEDATKTMGSRDPIKELLDKMREQASGADWMPHQKDRIAMQHTSLAFLAQVGNDLKQYDVDQIESQILDINNKGNSRDFTVKYHAVQAFAEHIEQALQVRKIELNNSIIGARVLVKELKESTHWQDKYPEAWPEGSDQLKINTMLNHLSKILKGQDSSGQEVDYQSNQPGSNHTQNALREQKEPGKLQELAEREYNALRNRAFSRIKGQAQKGTR